MVYPGFSRSFWWASAARPPIVIKQAMPSASVKVDPQIAGTISAAVSPLNPD
jgi:hypothetical protein